MLRPPTRLEHHAKRLIVAVAVARGKIGSRAIVFPEVEGGAGRLRGADQLRQCGSEKVVVVGAAE